MSARCHEIRAALAERGPDALRTDEEAQAHVAGCADCERFLEAARELDAALRELPVVDAPEALVARVREKIRSSPPRSRDRRVPPDAPTEGGHAWTWRPAHTRVAASLLAACLVLVISSSFRPLLVADRPPVHEAPSSRTGAVMADEPFADREAARVQAFMQRGPDVQRFASGETASPRRAKSRSEAPELQRELPAALYDTKFEGESAPAAPPSRQRRDSDPLSDLEARLSESASLRANEALAYLDPGRASRERRAKKDAVPMAGAGAPGDAPLEVPESGALSPAARFERERRALVNLSFQDPSGYWANTYVPGDPMVRWLESRLLHGNRTALRALSGGPLVLEAAARPVSQPFDPPAHSALAVYLHSDLTHVDRESRMLVQVGLQGTPRRSGIRSTMNVAVVLDLRGAVSTEIAPSVRALTDGFLKAKQVGDRFSLVVAGRPGAEIVSPEEFRHGPVSVKLGELFDAPEAGGGEGGGLDLPEAVETAIGRLEHVDDPGAPLGSSLLVLVTGQPLAPHTEAVARIAHRSAVAGIPTSVVGIGDRVRIDEIDRVILAGQGNRRLLDAPSQAEALVERELSALGRVVARAARLRIRLAPGVRLVEVIGSSRLDTEGETRVRQAERSIDRRMARNLGIEADRGEDEDGIQIVIPTLYGGDSHVILLDVVVPGPGPVADVTVRYKDLVYLGNGVARDSLVLGGGTARTGPLERNVVKNLLAIRLAETMKDAGRTLFAGGDRAAIARLREFRALLASLDAESPVFANDADLGTDIAMLDEYLQLIERGALEHPEPRDYLAGSMQLAGFFKTVPRLPTE